MKNNKKEKILKFLAWALGFGYIELLILDIFVRLVL